MDHRGDGVEVVDGRIEDFATGDEFDTASDAIDIPDEEETDDGSDTGADGTEEEAIAEEDGGDPAAWSAEGFEDPDIASFLDDDHEEGSQDPEAGDSDDHEKEDIEESGFELDGGEQGALGVAPAFHHEHAFGGEEHAEVIASGIEIDAGFEFDLDAGNGACGGEGIDHPTHALQFAKRDEAEGGVVFAHFGFVHIDDGKVGVDSARWGTGPWEGDRDIITGADEEVIFDFSFAIAVASATDADAEYDTGVDIFGGIEALDRIVGVDHGRGCAGVERLRVRGRRWILESELIEVVVPLVVVPLGDGGFAGGDGDLFDLLTELSVTFLFEFEFLSSAGHIAAVTPTAGLEAGFLGSVTGFAKQELETIAIFGVHEERAEIADLGIGFGIDADEINLLRVGLPGDAEGQHGGDGDHGGGSGQPVAEAFLYRALVELGFRDAGGGVAADDDIAEDAVDAIAHFEREAVHDTIDHDERRDTEGDGDDRSEGDPAGSQIPPAEQKSIHEHHPWLVQS